MCFFPESQVIDMETVGLFYKGGNIMDNLKYGIYQMPSGDLLAGFRESMDRNDCLDMLREKYSDCKFEARDIE
jgi:hypothetical protein